MTRDEILAMEPGRELDALVAEKVMGWAWGDMDSGLEGLLPPQDFRVYGLTPLLIFDDLGHLHGMPNYSTDISAAWGVVEKMNSPYIIASTEDGDQNWVHFGNEGNVAVGEVAEAICKAALIEKLSID